MSRDETQSKIPVRVSSNTIPVDLLIDIFSRVPSNSIARFRCVSKFWGSILQRPDFVELFLTRCPRFLFTLKVDEEILYFSSPQDHPNSDEKCVVATRYNTSFPKYVPLDLSSERTMICGLIFGYKDYGNKLRVICNPATGECITLPKALLKDKTSLKVKPSTGKFYFGYDPINKQFKVLCMTPSKSHRVLTLENGKRVWRKIESEFEFSGYSRFSGEVCINGVLYFGNSFHQSSSNWIVCFDVRSEKFSLINLDKDMVNKDLYSWGSGTLINYKGKFGIRMKKKEPTWNQEDNGFHLWVLEDAGNHKWSKHEHLYPAFWKKIRREHSLVHIIGMTSTGEMVFAPYNLSNPFYIFYYNFEKETFIKVNIRGLEEFSQEKPRISTSMDYWENMNLF